MGIGSGLIRQIPESVRSQQDAQRGPLNTTPDVQQYRPTSGEPQSAFYSTPQQASYPQTPFQFQPRGYASPFSGMGGKGGYSSMGGKGGYSPFNSFGGFSGYSGYQAPSNPYARAFEQNLMPTYYSPFGGKGGYSPFGGFGGYSSYDPYINPYSRAFEQNLMPTYQSNPYASQPTNVVNPRDVTGSQPGELKPGGAPLIGDRMPIRQPIGGKGFFKQGGQVK